MFGRKKAKTKYDPMDYKAVIKCSICTGEKVAGFQNIHTGKIEELMLIKSDKDLLKFKKIYNVDKIEKVY